MITYLVPSGYGTGEYSEKRSRFIGQIWPVESEAEALSCIATVKKSHYDARHNCFAYIVREGGVTRYSDDGEPQGTAGQPILSVLNGAELQNVCCTVTRYFGGILLGTGGLVRAYTEIAQMALADPPVAELVPLTRFTLALSYFHYETIRRRFPDFAAEITGEEFAAGVTLSGVIPSANFAAFSETVRDLTGGAATPGRLSSDA